MPEIVQIIIGIILLIGVYVLSQIAVGLRIKRAARGIVRDLDLKKARSPEAAIDLPYAKANFLRIGLRDFRPKAIDALVQGGIVGRNAEGKFYLKKEAGELNF